MRTLELSARISPCLHLFIEMLFDEVEVEHGMPWHQNFEFQSLLPEAIEKEEELARERFQ
jgi:hypothetical protein